MNQFKNVEDVWTAIDQGKTIYCSNKSYKIFIEPNIGSEENIKCEARMFSSRDGFMLSVRCIENYFGSVLHKSDLFHLFTDDEGVK